MKHSDAATKLVEHFEGCVLNAYPDPGTGADPWTIGWGATGAGIVKGVAWTQAEADARLDADLSTVDAQLTRLLAGVATAQNQFDAFVSFAYNLGEGALAGSTLLKKHKSGDYAGAAAEFVRWDKAAGRVLAGLEKRREAEAAVYAGHKD